MEIFDKFKDTRDKFESLFTIVVYDYSVTLTLEKIQHQLGLINLLSDKYRRLYLYNRLKEFKDYIANRFSDGNISSIFLVGKKTHAFDIIPEWDAIIKKFDIDKFIFKHGEFFELKYLKSLLTDDSYRSVILVSGSKFTHYHYNMSKRKYITQQTAKIADVILYIKNLDDTCIVHGTSNIIPSLLSDESLSKHIIEKRLLRDTEIEEKFQIRDNMIAAASLEYWLGNMLHPTLGKRLVFGGDISKKISEKLIKSVYCSEEMADKVRSKVPEHLKNFEIITIRTYSNDDIGRRLQKEFAGILGITYY
ncbi:MAG: hypothetical protein Harvfovirus54_4 [Harvfovirus sp.]|uniref:Uncharacterized protein n=1 Tax=Harvfovirus sp. TaxID=2487768 RepID=A0A3G5A3C1_9VIRU|nr:MAG: hypothetical protein Harvfovirus54_4 [Harvfovirus sp.]